MKTRKNNGISVRLLVMILALTLIIGGIVGGSVAWLTATTPSVTNTFTVGDIDIELTETTGAGYKVIPGVNITKDPKVTVKANSENCWLFVKIQETNWPASKVTYSIASGWSELTGHTGVYYRSVSSSTSDQVFPVIKDNKITVLDTLTKGEITQQFSLTIKAYAIQLNNGASDFTPADAWAQIPTT